MPLVHCDTGRREQLRWLGADLEHVAISLQGADQVEGLEALTAWFDEEPELRGLIARAGTVPDAGELGALSDTLVAALGGGGAISVLAASLKSFFSQPRGASIRLMVTRADGSRVELDADRVSDLSVPELVEKLLRVDSTGTGQ